jgi:hypothetical protein
MKKDHQVAMSVCFFNFMDNPFNPCRALAGQSSFNDG